MNRFKVLLVLGAAIAGVAAVQTRRGTEESVRPGGVVHSIPSAMGVLPPETNPAVVVAPLAEPVPAGEPASSTTIEATSDSAATPVEELRDVVAERMAVLDAELGMTPDQRRFVLEVLLAREAEVVTWHAEIRSSRVLNVWAHDRRAREILAASQARIHSRLTPEQSGKFIDLLDSGRLLEGIAFEVTPGMVVVR